MTINKNYNVIKYPAHHCLSEMVTLLKANWAFLLYLKGKINKVKSVQENLNLDRLN